ncbi:MAG: hypothetical protein J6K92_04750, partial [Oscillospiraceae bacterium]|nr:hypothetical protein [Oscillospiraceae bacterium]
MFSANEIVGKFGIKPPSDKSMEEAVKLWAECYRNVPPWVIADSDIRSLNLAYSISHEIARLVTLEFSSETDGSARAEYLSESYGKVIEDAPVWVEYACALGGVFLKPYICGEKICTDYVQADAAAVSEFDSAGNITGAVFADRITRNDKYFTRLESHSLKGSSYTVMNKAYVSDNNSQIGREVALEAVPEWADIAPSAQFEGIKRPLFVYFGMP